MTWDDSQRRKHELPDDWTQRRAAVLERDGGTCQLRYDVCTVQATDVDHVGDRFDHRLTNLRAVCRPCHNRHTAQQGAAAKNARYSEKRQPERHHGRLSPEEVAAKLAARAATT
jgi:5-methylcytosine-specific restriction protein A